MAKKKFYVVWSGKSTGVFETWDECRTAVHGVAGAKYKSYPSRAEAEAAFAGAAPEYKRKSTGSSSSRKSAPVAEERLSSYDYTLYCDGGAEPNPGNAGSGVAVYMKEVVIGLYYGLYEPNGTNNTAELKALTEALIMARNLLTQGRSVEILADSTYALKCVTTWADGWKRNGWRKRDGEIKNLEIIQDAHDVYCQIRDEVHCEHVKGHAGIEGNELADRMTRLATRRRERRWVQYTEPLDVAAILKIS